MPALRYLGADVKLVDIDPAIRAMVTPAKMIGRAVTVRITAPDSVLVHKATELLEPGDALVIDIGGDTRHAPVGEMVALAAQERRSAHAAAAAFRSCPSVRSDVCGRDRQHSSRSGRCAGPRGGRRGHRRIASARPAGEAEDRHIAQKECQRRKRHRDRNPGARLFQQGTVL